MFDQETILERLENGSIIRDNVPIRYLDNGTTQGTCINDYELTNGDILLSKSVMHFQKSCKPNTGNAGNWYSWPAATAGGSKSSGNELNSICPTGWQLTVNAASDLKSWYYLIRNTYNIQDNNDSKLLPLPMSFIRSGLYNQGSLNVRANYGNYWSSAVYDSNNAYSLGFYSGYLYPQYGNYYKNFGFSVRCVNRQDE